MMHLLFLANECVKFEQDPALFTRLSYLFLPFEFCKEPTEPHQKRIDTNIKEVVKTGVFNSELLFWALCLTPYLLRSTSSRKILPQPRAVQEDTESHEQAAKANRKIDGKQANDMAKNFVEQRVIEWTRESGEPPKDRREINEAFCLFVQGKCDGKPGAVPNPKQSLLNAGLREQCGHTRFKVMFQKRNYSAYMLGGKWATLKKNEPESEMPASSPTDARNE